MSKNEDYTILTVIIYNKRGIVFWINPFDTSHIFKPNVLVN
jgi:hypothetical protein